MSDVPIPPKPDPTITPTTLKGNYPRREIGVRYYDGASGETVPVDTYEKRDRGTPHAKGKVQKYKYCYACSRNVKVSEDGTMESHICRNKRQPSEFKFTRYTSQSATPYYFLMIAILLIFVIVVLAIGIEPEACAKCCEELGR
jgi:hypothetical protein